MRKYVLLLSVFVTALAGCHKHDRIWESIRDVENRLTLLEQQCKEMNTNISSMRVVVDVVQNNDYVTGVSPVLEDGVEIGYKISFNTHPSVIIYHGKDGQNGKPGQGGDDGNDGDDGQDGNDGNDGQGGLSPVIGVKQAEDGYFYWTQKLGDAPSTWILDEDGNKVKVAGSDGQSILTPRIGSNGNWWIGETDTGVKAIGQDGADGKDGQTPTIGSNGNWWLGSLDTGIKAQGGNGKDGITPQLKIENDNWMLSVDNGLTWRDLGRAKGDSGESFFADITDRDDKLILELKDGTTIELPKNQGFSFQLDKTLVSGIQPNTSYEINYAITGTENPKINIEAFGPSGWKINFQRTNFQNGKIVVLTPSGSTVSNEKVLVLVTDESGTTKMQSIAFIKGKLSVEQKEYMLPPSANTITITVDTDLDYTVNIATEDQAWINCQIETGNRESFTLDVSANRSEAFRYAIIELVNDEGFVLEKIILSQQYPDQGLIHVATAGTLKDLITTEELDKYYSLKITGTINSSDYDFLKSATDVRILDLSDLATRLIPANAFSESSLETVLLPKNLLTISEKAFYQSKITSIEIPETVTKIEKMAFAHCKEIQSDVVIPNSVTTIGESAFSYCNGKSLTLSSSLKEIASHAFYSSTFTGNLVIPEGIEKIGEFAFSDCSGFSGDLVIPRTCSEVGVCAFYKCTGFRGCLLLQSAPPFLLRTRAFSNAGGVLNFQKVYLKCSPPQTVNDTFASIFNSGTSARLPYVGVYAAYSTSYRTLIKDYATVYERLEWSDFPY